MREKKVGIKKKNNFHHDFILFFSRDKSIYTKRIFAIYAVYMQETMFILCINMQAVLLE